MPGTSTLLAQNSAAVSLARIEQKYLLHPAQVQQLRTKLAKALVADAFCGKEGYRVKSLYFDTPQNRDLNETLDGVYARQKIRLRIYDEADEQVKLECKAKRGQYQQKTTLTLNRAQAGQFIQGQYGFLLGINTAPAAHIYGIVAAGYRPVSVVEYTRHAYVWPQHNTRISLDSRVQGSATSLDLFKRNLPLLPILPPGATVLEVKYNRVLEAFLRDLLTGYCKVRLSVSKYANGRLAAQWADFAL